MSNRDFAIGTPPHIMAGEYQVGELPQPPEPPEPPEPPKRKPRIKGIKWGELPESVKMNLASKTKRKFLTRNSMCPCGSNRRYKRCCMLK